MRVADQSCQRLEAERLHARAFGQHHRGSAVVDARGIAGGDQAIFLEGRLHLRQGFHRGVGAHVLVGVEQHDALARLDFDRNDLLLEAAGRDGRSGASLAHHRQLVLLAARDVVACRHVLGSDAHVHLFPGVVQDAEHVVDQHRIAHAGTVARRRVEVRAAAHRLRAAADGDVAIAELDGLRRGNDRLQTGTAQAVHIESGGLDRAAGVDGGDPAQVRILDVGRDHVAHDNVANGVGRHATALQGGLDGGGGQLGIGHILQRAAESAYRGAGGADHEDVALGHVILSRVVPLRRRAGESILTGFGAVCSGRRLGLDVGHATAHAMHAHRALR